MTSDKPRSGGQNLGEDSGKASGSDELEENPAVTLYRNVRDMSRRDFLKLAGVGAAGVFGVTKGREVLEEGRPGAAGGGGGEGAAVGENSSKTEERGTTDAAEDIGIVHYLEGDVTEEDLSGHMDAVIWYDWMEVNRPTEETKEYMRQAFERAPVTNPDGTSGIDLHFIEGEKLKYEAKVDRSDIWPAYEDNVVPELQDDVWYLAFVEDIVGGYAGLALGGDNGGMVSDVSDTESIYDDVDKNTAAIALHELGHVMGRLEHKQEEPGTQGGPYTVMGDMKSETPLKYRDSEWKKILEESNVVSKGDYELLVPASGT
ncbi:MAG: twin-arginine translocation signal domain-containing protein [Candidatus Nanohaloarchaea archaeon]